MGPVGLGSVLSRLGDAAIVDSRVLLAHRLGADERRWPRPEDRLASDLLLPDLVEDPWLRTLTEGAVSAPIPVLLGGHSLVGPGLWLLFGSPRRSGGPHGAATARSGADAGADAEAAPPGADPEAARHGPARGSPSARPERGGRTW